MDLGYIFMIIGVIADGLKKPVRKAAKTLDKAAEAFMDKVMAEILRKREVRILLIRFGKLQGVSH